MAARRVFLSSVLKSPGFRVTAPPIFALARRNFARSAPRAANADAFVNVLDPDGSALSIASNTAQHGMLLSDQTRFRQSALILNDLAMLWNTPRLEEADLRWTGWTADVFAALEVVEPRPELLIVGTGPTLVPMPPNLRSFFSSLGIAVDVQDSRNACAAYNLLREEGRRVGAAIMPMNRSA